jgi:ribosomal protein S18 acetylase RimI-like enzyme
MKDVLLGSAHPAAEGFPGPDGQLELAHQHQEAAMELEFRPTQLTEAEIRHLRAATGKDLPFAADVLSGRVKFRECLHDGRVVGHCIGNSATGEVLGLSVDHGYRRHGIARTLLSLVVDLLRADGTQRIWLAAPTDPTQPAYQFYRALGWRPTGKHPADGLEIIELQAPKAP